MPVLVPAPPPLSQPALLLVEDDLVEARRLESVLEGLGYETVHAGDGDRALALMTERRFDVVLLDLVLPELDGMGLLGAMRRRGLKVPVVVAVTGEGVDAAASAIRAGARDFVVKPAGALRLEVALANAVALGAALRPASTLGPAGTGARSEERIFDSRPRDWGAIVSMPQAEGLASREAEASDAAPRTGCEGQAADRSGREQVMGVEHWVAGEGHVRPLEEIEAQAIRFACAHYGGRLTEVARRLGIGRSTLYRKLSRLGWAPPGESGFMVQAETAHIVAAE